MQDNILIPDCFNSHIINDETPGPMMRWEWDWNKHSLDLVAFVASCLRVKWKYKWNRSIWLEKMHLQLLSFLKAIEYALGQEKNKREKSVLSHITALVILWKEFTLIKFACYL